MQVPEYITVTRPNGDLMAYLAPDSDGLKDCWLDNQLNGPCLLTFMLPMTCSKWEYLTDAYRIHATGREFVVIRPEAIDVIRDGEKLWGKVMAQESTILLEKRFVTVSNDPQNPDPAWGTVSILSGGPAAGGYPAGSAGSALTYLLQGSGWSVGEVDVTGRYDLESERVSLLGNISKVQELWGGYLVWDSLNKTVSLRSETAWQNYTGFQIRYAKNLKSITRTVDYDMVTRLYPFGEDDLTIAAVNDGLLYLEDHSYSGEIFEGIYTNQKLGTPEELKAKALDVLAKLARPRYNYRINIVDLRTLPEYQHEDFALGDIVDVIDEGLGINVRARVIRHKYNVFMPWKCDLEVGDPVETLASMIAETRTAAKFVKNTLRPNRSIGNLMKGFIDTFATQINGAKGKLVWNNDTFEAIEVDASGQETGNRVRITPGGVGISSDGGQTFRTAMTGAGILANTVIVNELYALATEDGYTKLTGSGLEVYDNQETPVKRLHAGQYADGKFGLELRDKTGQVTILDEDGIMQTWQDSRADNVDASHPLEIPIYLPPETRRVHRALLRLRLQPFRAYETGAASGGGVTSGPSSTATTATDRSVIVVSSYVIDHSAYKDTTGPENGTITTTMKPAGGHNHELAAHNHTDSLGGPTNYNKDGIFPVPDHVHPMDALPPHNHHLYPHEHVIIDEGHKHQMQHTHDTPQHSHGLVFGIYQGATATAVNIRVNGMLIGGPYNSNQDAIDIRFALSPGWNIVNVSASGLGRIDATIFLQSLLGIS